jgi:hypothetical protein
VEVAIIQRIVRDAHGPIVPQETTEEVEVVKVVKVTDHIVVVGAINEATGLPIQVGEIVQIRIADLLVATDHTVATIPANVEPDIQENQAAQVLFKNQVDIKGNLKVMVEILPEAEVWMLVTFDLNILKPSKQCPKDQFV